MEQKQRMTGEREKVHTEQWPGSPDERSDATLNRPADALMQRVLEFTRAVKLPESTYRLQFHKGFTFRDAAAIVPYLAKLGITHLYASPYLKATPGSMHGYDVIDHCSLNPEVGTQEDYDAWIAAMQQHGMSHVLDTVPNHVGVGTNENRWWNEVLENGPASRYAGHFDIAWLASPRPELQNRVLLPVLGDLYGRVLERGELKLVFEAEKGSFAVRYYDHRLPVTPCSYGKILEPGMEMLLQARGPGDAAVMEYASILLAARNLPDRLEKDPWRRTLREQEKEVIKRRLARLVNEEEQVRAAVEKSVQAFNGTPGDERSFDRLDDLLSHQCYRLAHWRNAAEEINYRRFFDVNTLAALAMERPEVFEETHALTLRLCAQGKVAGLRIDHPDGLYDPQAYFARLQRGYLLAVAEELAGQEWDRLEPAVRGRLAGAGLSGWRGTTGGTWPLYAVAEKILAIDEPAPEEWPCYGTSGYDFLNMVNGIFVDQTNEGAFTRLYEELTGEKTHFEDLVYQKKLLILDKSLSSELQMLTEQLDRIAQKDRRWRDFTFNALHEALRQVIACFPVYRPYVSERGVHEADRQNVQRALDQVQRRNPALEGAILVCIRDVLLQAYPSWATPQDHEAYLHFAGKFQQLTSPVTAKGVEDTAFYLYHRLISLNEVGGEPGRFGLSTEAFHRYMQQRQARWPYALSTLSTHDTKRSEDVRARINVLSEIPDEWQQQVKHWHVINAPHRQADAPAPDECYLLYQTLLGAWPVEPLAGSLKETFVSRIQAYMLKAIKEGKQRTSWTDPDPEHEKGVTEFVGRILSDQAFLQSFEPFAKKIAWYGRLNSLSQTALRLTCPGVPDTYQGTELWDLSLVDPDNRRPVDYGLRRQMLQSLEDTDAASLLGAMEGGQVKLFVTATLLQLRQSNPGLFSRGEYEPLAVTGRFQNHAVAFCRRHGGTLALVVVPRLAAKMMAGEMDMPLGDRWEDTYLRPADPIEGTLQNVLTGAAIKARGGGLPLAEVLKQFPVAVLMGKQ